jgi:hypothetical protein
VEVLYSAILPKDNDFESRVKPEPGDIEVSNGVGLSLFTSIAVSMNAAHTMSPEVGTAERLKVKALPVAVVSSVPVPPIDDMLQFSTSVTHAPARLLSGLVGVPAMGTVIRLVPAASPNTYQIFRV